MFLYVCGVYVRVCACVKVHRDLMVRGEEMEGGLEWGVEGWGGPLIWKVWCEWRTSGSPTSWILPHMQYGKVIHPYFPSFYLLPPSASPVPYLSLPPHQHATTFPLLDALPCSQTLGSLLHESKSKHRRVFFPNKYSLFRFWVFQSWNLVGL